MDFKVGDRVKRSDANEDSIPAYRNMRGTVLGLVGSRVRVRWDCDGMDTYSTLTPPELIASEEDGDEPKSQSFRVSPQALARQILAEESGIKDPRPDQCASCGKTVNAETDFVDTLSKKEWRITQLCQACQDVVFAPPPGEEE